jgi:hypothetical protein
VLLCTSGGLMCAASWQRWGDACPWGAVDGPSCLSRQDHRYDFVFPSTPWEPVGDAAQLAGSSMLVLALAFALLPWALRGRRPGVVSLAGVAVAVLALGATGVATLRSGLDGSVVHPVGSGMFLFLWLAVPPVLLGSLSVAARGWSRAASILLVLATPLVAELSYAVGPYDARPWWEAISGLLTVMAGLCLLAASASSSRSRAPRGAVPDGPRAAVS